MATRICPKCLEVAYLGGVYCSSCGTRVSEVTFSCECGTELHPSFTYRFFPPWSRALNPYHKHCARCGRNVEDTIRRQIRELRIPK